MKSKIYILPICGSLLKIKEEVMISKVRKTFIIGSLIASFFMAITACNITGSSQSSNQNTSVSSNIISSGASENSTTTSSSTSSSSSSTSSSMESSSSSSSSSIVKIVLTSISAVSNKESYEWGEDLDITVTATYSDGSSKTITDYVVNGYNNQVSGEQNITISYEEQECSLNVLVKNPALVRIEVIPNKNTYEWGEDLDIVVKAIYADGSSIEVTDYEVNGYNKELSGEQELTITYEGKSCSLKVRVNYPVLVKITAVSNKDAYEWGEDLDITVTATYSDGSHKTITDYEVSGYDKETSGEQNIVISYEGKTFGLKVKVNDPVLVSITATSNKDTYEWGEQLDIVVIATYSDGSTVVITDYQVSGYNNQLAGLQDVTITYEGKSCSLKVSVKERVNLFPVDKLNAFLELENLDVDIPSPIGYEKWNDQIKQDIDGSKSFVATTPDNGTVGVDSIADQYALLLTNAGWTISSDEYGFNATKEGFDIILTFKTSANTFRLCVSKKYEFPSRIDDFVLATSKGDITDGEIIVFGNPEESFAVTGLENGVLTTRECAYRDDKPVGELNTLYPFVFKQSGSIWNIIDQEGRKLGATDVEQLAWDSGTTDWVIYISPTATIITNLTTSYGSLRYNPATKAITNIKSTSDRSIIYPNLYKHVVTDVVYPTAITITGRNEVALGKNSGLSVEYTPSNTNSFKDIEWSSSNEQIVKVKDGIVTGVALGKATITAITKSKNSYLEASFEIEVKETTPDSWTIMVYMCGSDLESGSYHFASADIREMLSVSGQPDDVNVIIETGGSRSWNYSGIDRNALSRYHLENKKLVLDEKLSNASMGSQSTFESFLNWGLKNYPADKTGVILWNHGGALDGCCYDENYNYDGLTNSESFNAFKNAFKQNNIKQLEFVGYDACLMQVQDVAEFNSHYFKYMVGSEEAEDGYGWAYSEWLDDVYYGKDTRTILKATCDSFVASCGNDSDQCLSYLDLSKMSNYHAKFEEMAAAIKSTAKNNWNGFKSIINNSKRYTDFSTYGVMDGLDFLNNLGNDATYNQFNDSINAAKTAYKQLIGYSKAGTAAGRTNGLAVIAATKCSYPSTETSFTNWRSIFK